MMPITIDLDIKETASIDDVIDYFSSINLSDQDAILGGSKVLRALANDKTFLTKRITEELRNQYSVQSDNQYSSQVFFLAEAPELFIRANFWPSENDSIISTSGKNAFFYGVPHDHNFDFLTVGYYGPGYISDFYEYDRSSVVGFPGEKIKLRFVGREALPEGRLMLYRKSLDIHEQLPGEEFSISLNVVMNLKGEITTINQYMIDLQSSRIQSLANRTSLPLLCEVAAHIGDEECRDILTDLCEAHPYSRGRFSAYQALAHLCPSDEINVWERAAADRDAYVYTQAKIHLELIEREIVR